MRPKIKNKIDTTTKKTFIISSRKIKIIKNKI